MKIGFFGDSFCQYDVPEDWQNVDYETYITKLKKHYNAEIVNLGQSGSSIYDLILLQIKPFIDTNYYPDVCIFVWTDIARLFHRNHRNLNIHTIDHEKENFTIRAAKQYFAYLYDANLQKLFGNLLRDR